ncbi:MAG: sugar 3,4-ketoisomerase [Rectinemataceae bacterium]
MPSLVDLKTVRQSRGSLTVIEKVLPFAVKRIFYIYDVPPGTNRGGHSHKKTRMALIALNGRCRISGARGAWEYRLDDPSSCLILDPPDWHDMFFEVPGTILLCLASEEFDADDYVDEPPAKDSKL